MAEIAEIFVPGRNIKQFFNWYFRSHFRWMDSRNIDSFADGNGNGRNVFNFQTFYEKSSV